MNELAPEENRSEVISMYLIACYAGISLPVLGIGFLSKLASPRLANLVFAGVTVLLALIAMAVALAKGGKQRRSCALGKRAA